MKRIVAIILFLFLTIEQYAQIEKGTYLPGITLNGYYQISPVKDSTANNKIDNNWAAGANINFGKFVKDNLLLSIGLNYTHATNKQQYTDNLYYYRNLTNYGVSNTEGINVSVKKYKFLGNNFAFFYGLSFSPYFVETLDKESYYQNSLIQGQYEYVPVSSSSYANTLNLQGNLNAGILYFLNENVAITGGIGFFSALFDYSPHDRKKYPNVKKYDFSASLTPSFNAFNVGLNYYIRPKMKKVP